ncbi:MAG: hypothetical protein IJ735_06595 [Clostridia bacterium]|nr:hypothetical protein [Clostridia bacterium]
MKSLLQNKKTIQRQKRLYSIYTVAALIAIAVTCRFISRDPNTPLFLNKTCNLIRTLIYSGLFATWGVSVYRRVVQVQARKFLVILAALMAVWVILRAFKFYFITDVTAERYLWYTYYFPMLFIPTLTLFVALSIGKNEGYRLPNYAFLLLVPATILAILALTNDLHQCVFRFPENAAFSENDYSYAWGYILVVIWGVSCGLASLVLMFVKSRLPKNRPALWIPIIPFAVVIVYVILYALRVPFAFSIGWDLAVFECLSFTVFLESCIMSGLIQSNIRYEDMFRASQGLSAQITDKAYNVRYAAENAEAIDRATLEKAETAPVIIDNKLLHNMPIRGGRAIWTDDITELLEVKESLELTQEELKDRNDFLQYSYKREEENKIVEEQNRLYDLLQSKTQKQIDSINRLVNEYKHTASDEEKHRILSEIVVLGCFIKRRKDFVLLTDYTPMLPDAKLTNAFAESFRALGLYGVKGTFSVKTNKEYVSGDVLTKAYDYFEDVIETALDKAKYITARVYEVRGMPRISIAVDCKIDTKNLVAIYPEMQLDESEEETEFYLPLLGGAK